MGFAKFTSLGSDASNRTETKEYLSFVLLRAACSFQIFIPEPVRRCFMELEIFFRIKSS
jgi:hypothetical protein